MAVEIAKPTGRKHRSTLSVIDRIKQALRYTIIYLLLTLIAVVSLFPLYWLFVTALTPASATLKLPPQMLQTQPTLQNFAEILRISGKGKLALPLLSQPIVMARLPLWFVNTTFYALASTVIHVLFDSMAGYAFAKRKFLG